ncbi:MAG TPA: hypothetical protein PKC42_04310 [Candidatus Nanoperiomorbaceae bacterium]|nr:hypothetical protein [Candidatus Nanoperiomorbaceae bacterium]
MSWGKSLYPAGLFPIHLFAITNTHNENEQSAVLNAGDNPVIAYTILPEVSQLGTFKGFANTARVFELSNPFMQEAENAPHYWWIELVEFTDGGRG